MEILRSHKVAVADENLEEIFPFKVSSMGNVSETICLYDKMAESENDVDVMEVDKEVITIYDDEDMAEVRKDEGNKLYQLKRYREALSFYSEAIALQPENASYYGNRTACYLMLGQFKEALEDARKSVLLDPTFVKGYVRMAKCFIHFGDLAAAKSAITKAKELCPEYKAAEDEARNIDAIVKFKEEADKAYEKKEYRKTIYYIGQAQNLGVSCSSYKLCKAECLAFLGRYHEAKEIANDVLQFDKQNPDAIYIRGVCIYYGDSAGNIEHACTHFQHALKLAPDHSKLLEIYKKAKLLNQKKEEGNEAFKASRFQEAYDIYTEALNVDPNNNLTNAKLYFNRATVSSKLGKLEDAIEDCSAALKLDEKYLKALLRRAWCYMELKNYKEAVRDYEQIYKMDMSRENKRLLHEAKLELKKSSRKDYYKILGIAKTATTDEIKKAYRKRALVHHPDRHADASEPERLEQEKKFKEVGEAYGVLSDPKKRQRYDNGQDLEDMEEIDPNGVFYTFFGGPSSGNFSFSSYGFPGSGFTFQFA